MLTLPPSVHIYLATEQVACVAGRSEGRSDRREDVPAGDGGDRGGCSAEMAEVGRAMRRSTSLGVGSLRANPSGLALRSPPRPPSSRLDSVRSGSNYEVGRSNDGTFDPIHPRVARASPRLGSSHRRVDSIVEPLGTVPHAAVFVPPTIARELRTVRFDFSSRPFDLSSHRFELRSLAL